jgi:predicted transcriptional regulator
MITGELIKRMRKEIGITQEQLAKAVGITQAHVAKIENEKVNPTLSTINKIMSVLDTNRKIKCKDLVTKRVIFMKPDDTINYAAKLMREKDISQIPIIDREKCVGSISEKTIVRNLANISGSTVLKELMDEPFPIISCNDSINVVKALLEYHQAVLVSENGKIIGIVTKSDLLKLLK